jgi:hypothetical protein
MAFRTLHIMPSKNTSTLCEYCFALVCHIFILLHLANASKPLRLPQT